MLNCLHDRKFHFLVDCHSIPTRQRGFKFLVPDVCKSTAAIWETLPTARQPFAQLSVHAGHTPTSRWKHRTWGMFVSVDMFAVPLVTTGCTTEQKFPFSSGFLHKVDRGLNNVF